MPRIEATLFTHLTNRCRSIICIKKDHSASTPTGHQALADFLVIALLILKKNFRGAIPKSGVVLVYKIFYLFFGFKDLMYFFFQPTLADSKNNNKVWLVMSDCQIIPLFKFFQLNIYYFKI